jgi:hypothetical protein
MSGKLESLTSFERKFLAVLPAEPVGLSLAELADGLPDSTGPQARGQVRAALDAVGQSSSSWGQGFTRSTSF